MAKKYGQPLIPVRTKSRSVTSLVGNVEGSEYLTYPLLPRLGPLALKMTKTTAFPSDDHNHCPDY